MSNSCDVGVGAFFSTGSGESSKILSRSSQTIQVSISLWSPDSLDWFVKMQMWIRKQQYHKVESGRFSLENSTWWLDNQKSFYRLLDRINEINSDCHPFISYPCQLVPTSTRSEVVGLYSPVQELVSPVTAAASNAKFNLSLGSNKSAGCLYRMISTIFQPHQEKPLPNCEPPVFGQPISEKKPKAIQGLPCPRPSEVPRRAVTTSTKRPDCFPSLITFRDIFEIFSSLKGASFKYEELHKYYRHLQHICIILYI